LDYLEKIYTLIYTALSTQSTIALPKLKSEAKDPYAFVELIETDWQDVSDESGRQVVYRGEVTMMLSLYFKVSQDTLFAGTKRLTQSRLMRILEKALGTLEMGKHTIGTSGDSYQMTLDDIRMTKDIYDINNASMEGTAVRYFTVKFTYWL